MQRSRRIMANLTPRPMFQLDVSERELHLITIGLAVLAGGDVKPSPESRRQAAELNLRLTKAESQSLSDRGLVVERKLDIAQKILVDAIGPAEDTPPTP